MKGYGLPRNDDVTSPDCADIQLYGLRARLSQVEKHGCVKNSFRNPVKKQRLEGFGRKKREERAILNANYNKK